MLVYICVEIIEEIKMFFQFIYKYQNKLHGYPTSARPTASLPFCQYLAGGLTDHPNHCMLMSEFFLIGQVDVYVASLVDIDWVIFSLAYRQDKHTHTHTKILSLLA